MNFFYGLSPASDSKRAVVSYKQCMASSGKLLVLSLTKKSVVF